MGAPIMENPPPIDMRKCYFCAHGVLAAALKMSERLKTHPVPGLQGKCKIMNKHRVLPTWLLNESDIVDRVVDADILKNLEREKNPGDILITSTTQCNANIVDKNGFIHIGFYQPKEIQLPEQPHFGDSH